MKSRKTIAKIVLYAFTGILAFLLLTFIGFIWSLTWLKNKIDEMYYQ